MEAASAPQAIKCKPWRFPPLTDPTNAVCAELCSSAQPECTLTAGEVSSFPGNKEICC